MAKDYKHRLQTKTNKRSAPKPAFGLFASMLVSSAIMMLVVGVLYMVKNNAKKSNNTPIQSTHIDNRPNAKPNESKLIIPPQPIEPQFDFYTILPEHDVVVPDYEIKTRAREESIGQTDNKLYVIQMGSFKTLAEAERLTAKLNTMGIESNIQKAKVGNSIWYRVKSGTYSQMSSVSTVRERLRHNGIDIVVTEMNNQ